MVKVESAKILGLFPTPAHSHFTLGSRLMIALAKKGHQVTVVSPFTIKVPIENYEEIPVENMREALEGNYFCRYKCGVNCL